jgi:outer membrane receptor protein involved in Fe transport
VARFRVGDPIGTSPTTFLSRPAVNNSRLPTYARLDASVLYRFRMLTANWEARLNLFNLLNRGNVVSRTYAPTDAGVAVSSQRGLPILPLLELEMSL